MESRRDFIKSASLASLALAGMSCYSSDEKSEADISEEVRNIERLGVGLFTIPFLLQDDFEGSLKMIADAGYKEVELFGPYDFSLQTAKDYWAPIAQQLGFTNSGHYGHSPQEVRTILDNVGLTSPSMHADLGTMENSLEPLAEASAIVGHKYAGIAAIPDDQRKTLDDYKRMAERFNAIGAALKPYDIKFLYHNHGYGLVEMEGEIPFNVLVEMTDPDLVALELDVYWFTAGRADIPAYLDAYPNRFKMMHVKDMVELTHFAGDGGDPSQWMELFPKMVDAGAGVIDLDTILKKAYSVGVDHFYLERDLTATPEKTLIDSYAYMSNVEV